MLRRLKRILPQRLKTRIKHAMGMQDMETRLRNLRASGFNCASAVDVGAFAGDWTVTANSILGCTVIAVEPQPSQQRVLRDLAARIPMRLESIALAEREGEMTLLLEETNSRLLPDAEAAGGAQCVKVPVDRLDEVLRRHSDLRPNLLKLDVQGHELHVLDGAGDALRQFEVIVMEVSVIRIGPVPIFQEVIEYMRRRDFRLYDFLPMYYRPLDGALWQGDAFFVRNDSPLVASERWA
jgi:FkbM family methyltransferase